MSGSSDCRAAVFGTHRCRPPVRTTADCRVVLGTKCEENARIEYTATHTHTHRPGCVASRTLTGHGVGRLADGHGDADRRHADTRLRHRVRNARLRLLVVVHLDRILGAGRILAVLHHHVAGVAHRAGGRHHRHAVDDGRSAGHRLAVCGGGDEHGRCNEPNQNHMNYKQSAAIIVRPNHCDCPWTRGSLWMCGLELANTSHELMSHVTNSENCCYHTRLKTQTNVCFWQSTHTHTHYTQNTAYMRSHGHANARAVSADNTLAKQ